MVVPVYNTLEEVLRFQYPAIQNKEYENINLKKEMNEKNAEINVLSNEDNDVSTNNGRRYSETLRTCVMELQGNDIPTNKISNVIKVVSDHKFNASVQLPCRTTISDICVDVNVVAKHQVSETLANANNFNIFADGTGRLFKNSPMGRDALPQFERFKDNSEPPVVREIRTVSEVLGPRGDEKNGVQQQQLACLSPKGKSSKIINYRSN
ncbi:unnamed protein product [Mytilus coruscus]|uniref:Uncharacterized protein n=1 Tax=Mytilus coruscus TaxID=42192 RepID=A0A6J8DAW2_MYTCO|nr:unnamed protein product [Mytilus coruscus]